MDLVVLIRGFKNGVIPNLRDNQYFRDTEYFDNVEEGQNKAVNLVGYFFMFPKQPHLGLFIQALYCLTTWQILSRHISKKMK